MMPTGTSSTSFRFLAKNHAAAPNSGALSGQLSFQGASTMSLGEYAPTLGTVEKRMRPR